MVMLCVCTCCDWGLGCREGLAVVSLGAAGLEVALWAGLELEVRDSSA